MCQQFTHRSADTINVFPVVTCTAHWVPKVLYYFIILTSPDCQPSNAATLSSSRYWLILQQFAVSISVLFRLDFRRFLVSDLRYSPRIDWTCEQQSISARCSETSTDENHRQTHMTLSAHKICCVFASSFKFGPPTYFISHHCCGRASHVFYRKD